MSSKRITIASSQSIQNKKSSPQMSLVENSACYTASKL